MHPPPVIATLALAATLAATLAPSSFAGKTGYLQEGRYYASPAGNVAWLEVTDRLLLVSDTSRAVAAISRSDGAVAWSHHPSGGRVDALWLSPDSRSLVVAGVDLEVLDTATGTMRWAMRLGCKRPCENRVQAVSGNAIYVTGSGVTHQWLWRYHLADGRAAWSKPLPITHPRAFAISAAGPAWLLEANAPFAIRRLDLDRPALASRTLWTSANRRMAPQQLSALRDGRALIVGPLPGGGLPAIAMVPGAGTLPPRTLPLARSGMAGARVSRVDSHNRLLAAIARTADGTQALAVWDINHPAKPAFTGTATHQLALLPTHHRATGRLTAALRQRTETRLVGLDDTTGALAFDRRLEGSGRVRLFDASGAVALLQGKGTHGALALFDPATGALVGVGSIDRASTARVARTTPTGLYVGAGRGVLSLLRVPLARAFPELQQATAAGPTPEGASLQTALRWAPEAQAAMTAMYKGAARANARSLRSASGDARITGIANLLRGAANASASDAVGAIQPLLMVVAEAGLDRSSAGTNDHWRRLASTVQSVLETHGATIVKGRQQGGEPDLRGLVVLTSASLLVRGQSQHAMSLLARWLALPVTPEPGLEAMREVAALIALDTLFASQVGSLASPDDARRHAAARLLAQFTGTRYALGDADWLEERARPVLTPSRPESMRAATALASELRSALQKRTLGGRLGLGGPGCALTCRALRHACDRDCHPRCERRYKRCLKTCKRRRVVRVKPTPDACR